MEEKIEEQNVFWTGSFEPVCTVELTAVRFGGSGEGESDFGGAQDSPESASASETRIIDPRIIP